MCICGGSTSPTACQGAAGDTMELFPASFKGLALIALMLASCSAGGSSAPAPMSAPQGQPAPAAARRALSDDPALDIFVQSLTHNQALDVGDPASALAPATTLAGIGAPEDTPCEAEGLICDRRQAALLFAAATLAQPTAQAAVTSLQLEAPLTLADVTPQVAPSQPLSAREQAVVALFERNTNSVVNIFDVTLGGGPRQTALVDAPEGNGTGFILDTSGHIVTNYHVLQSVLGRLPPRPASGTRAQAAKVALVTVLLGPGNDTQTFDGYLIGMDRAKDLCVLQIRPPQDVLRRLRPASLGTSADLRVGQAVNALGNPFGFDHTLTTGVISGLGREINSQLGGVIAGAIQTDAAINPGNSGGPLLDMAGRVIGVNTAIFTNSGTSAGLGFAIGVDTVRRVVPQLIASGRFVRASLGIQVANGAVARTLKVPRGAMVQSVAPGGAGERAGLLPPRRSFGGVLPGDVVTAVDRTVVAKPGDLANALEMYDVGDAVSLTVLRSAGESAQQELKLQAKLQADSA
ncbi:hypothetical protein WJX81_005978 [Elliptochloris bilobata]|uniref:PDZ domain-containing protein n=1 Tax=Elliptochloris bilobata TaxID=381761 RepID=A0AAW1QHN8_9CHLO